MQPLPPDVVAYKRTPTFDETSVPKALLADHRTKAGVWALVVIEEGSVALTIDGETHTLSPGLSGVSPPEVPHHLTLRGPVRLHVVFHRAE